MPDPRRIFGTLVEKQVELHLQQKGYEILERQFKMSFGEVDLICRDRDEIVFIEVKARRSSAFGFPEQSVNANKLRKIVKCAQVFLQSCSQDQLWRVDVIAVEDTASPRLVHIKAVDIPERFW